MRDDIISLIFLPFILWKYGQTSSGKTYTLTGGERYADRGIIPRAISQVFNEVRTRSDTSKYTIYISYLEIYNENVYDLLDDTQKFKSIEHWSKISLQNDKYGDLHLMNLRVFEARSEEEALELLFIGNDSRVSAETPMNQASSRSHCIFTISIEERSLVDETRRISKLNLVSVEATYIYMYISYM